MDYATLYFKVANSLESGQRFSIQVETYRTDSGPSTEWQIYVPFNHVRGTLMVEGLTAEEAWERFSVELITDAETIEQTSAAVGDATVDS